MFFRNWLYVSTGTRIRNCNMAIWPCCGGDRNTHHMLVKQYSYSLKCDDQWISKFCMIYNQPLLLAKVEARQSVIIGTGNTVRFFEPMLPRRLLQCVRFCTEFGTHYISVLTMRYSSVINVHRSWKLSMCTDLSPPALWKTMFWALTSQL